MNYTLSPTILYIPNYGFHTYIGSSCTGAIRLDEIDIIMFLSTEILYDPSGKPNYNINFGLEVIQKVKMCIK